MLINRYRGNSTLVALGGNSASDGESCHLWHLDPSTLALGTELREYIARESRRGVGRVTGTGNWVGTGHLSCSVGNDGVDGCVHIVVAFRMLT